jgi:transcriptional regulator with XRE-family HTH domain
VKRGPVPLAVPKVTEMGLRRRLAANVRRLRKALLMTQDAASERGHLALRHWQKIEAGEANAGLSTLVKVANALLVDPAELFAPLPPRS